MAAFLYLKGGKPNEKTYSTHHLIFPTACIRTTILLPESECDCSTAIDDAASAADATATTATAATSTDAAADRHYAAAIRFAARI